MRDLTKEEIEFFIRISENKPQKKGSYWYYQHKKKMHKRARVVMQLHLNKKLEMWEIVHHINEKKWDDRIKNLEVMSLEEHSSHHH